MPMYEYYDGYESWYRGLYQPLSVRAEQVLRWVLIQLDDHDHRLRYSMHTLSAAACIDLFNFTGSSYWKTTVNGRRTHQLVDRCR
jgi:hypothetical protein